MPIKLHCPHCRRGWSIPRKHAGTKFPCPSCQGEMDVPTLATATLVAAPTTEFGGPVGSVGTDLNSGAPDLPGAAQVLDATEPPAHGPPNQRDSSKPAGTAKLISNRPSPQSSKVAKFIAAGADRPAVEIAADGRLPELKLAEGVEKVRSMEKSAGSNPMLLVIVMLVSLGLSVVMLFTDFDSGGSTSDRKREARAQIEKYFFGDDSKPLAPYQLLLREAQQAHSRGDRRAEREFYQRVVELLRAERRTGFTSVTANQLDDKKLEDLISQLLSDK